MGPGQGCRCWSGSCRPVGSTGSPQRIKRRGSPRRLILVVWLDLV